VLFLPDRHVRLEIVDEPVAGLQRRAAVNGTDGDHDGEIADLEVADPMLPATLSTSNAAATRSTQARSASAALGCPV